MKKALLFTNPRGFTLIEALLAGALFSLLALAFASASIYGVESAALAARRTQAVLLADEGLEAARNIRDGDGYAALADGTYGLSATGSSWAFSGSSDTTDVFTRAIGVTTVGDYKEVTSTVTWQQNAQRTGVVTLATRFTDWLAERLGDWTAPSTEATLDLAGAENGLKVAASGDDAYVIRNGGALAFSVVDVSNSASPTLRGSTALTGTPVNIAVSGDYAYVTSTANAAELQIVDVSNSLLPVVVGVYDAAGGANGAGIAVDGTTVYLGRASSANDEFFVLNVSNPLLPTLTGSLNLSGNANDLAVSGSSVYVASSDNSSELQVVSVATPSAPSLAGSLNLSGTTDGLSVVLFDAYAAVGRNGGGGIAVVSVATPSAPSLVATVVPGGAVNDLAAVGSAYLLAATAVSGGEFVVVDVGTPSSAVVAGSVNTTTTLDGVAYDGVLDRAYVVSSDNAEELLVMMPN